MRGVYEVLVMAEQKYEYVLVGVSLDPPPANKPNFRTQHCAANFPKLVEKILHKFPEDQNFRLIILIGDSFQVYRMFLDQLRDEPNIMDDDYSKYIPESVSLGKKWQTALNDYLSQLEQLGHKIYFYSDLENKPAVIDWSEKVNQSYENQLHGTKAAIDENATAYFKRYIANNGDKKFSQQLQERGVQACKSAKKAEYAIMLWLVYTYNIKIMSYPGMKTIPAGLAALRKKLINGQKPEALTKSDATCLTVEEAGNSSTSNYDSMFNAIKSAPIPINDVPKLPRHNSAHSLDKKVDISLATSPTNNDFLLKALEVATKEILSVKEVELKEKVKQIALLINTMNKDNQTPTDTLETTPVASPIGSPKRVKQAPDSPGRRFNK